eukprot:CAMPEP_0172489522 /NCGR_PEP_ID=MMETSP1066-20121228/19577_1 /TAXON_ID=671091 /ORGANISM="Coscinodiscus wailesii, Strain CCMP2513" /LENGTH=1702 /DNA_ID=CAMNT_0013257455 /DNA_START=188 /DNA_END=5296 /DNA_ORIENTATION=+
MKDRDNESNEHDTDTSSKQRKKVPSIQLKTSSNSDMHRDNDIDIGSDRSSATLNNPEAGTPSRSSLLNKKIRSIKLKISSSSSNDSINKNGNNNNCESSVLSSKREIHTPSKLSSADRKIPCIQLKSPSSSGKNAQNVDGSSVSSSRKEAITTSKNLSMIRKKRLKIKSSVSTESSSEQLSSIKKISSTRIKLNSSFLKKEWNTRCEAKVNNVESNKAETGTMSINNSSIAKKTRNLKLKKSSCSGKEVKKNDKDDNTSSVLSIGMGASTKSRTLSNPKKIKLKMKPPAGSPKGLKKKENGNDALSVTLDEKQPSETKSGAVTTGRSLGSGNALKKKRKRTNMTDGQEPGAPSTISSKSNHTSSLKTEVKHYSENDKRKKKVKKDPEQQTKNDTANASSGDTKKRETSKIKLLKKKKNLKDMRRAENKAEAIKGKPTRPKPTLKLKLSLGKAKRTWIKDKKSTTTGGGSGASETSAPAPAPPVLSRPVSRGKGCSEATAAAAAKKRDAAVVRLAAMPQVMAASSNLSPVPSRSPSGGELFQKALEKWSGEEESLSKSEIFSSSPSESSDKIPSKRDTKSLKPLLKDGKSIFEPTKLALRIVPPSRRKDVLPKAVTIVGKSLGSKSLTHGEYLPTPSGANEPSAPTTTTRTKAVSAPPLGKKRIKFEIGPNKNLVRKNDVMTERTLPLILPDDDVSMTPLLKKQCSKVISAIIRRRTKNVQWFRAPVSDRAIIDDYRQKIPFPMDLGTLAAKLEGDKYKKIADFVRDLRRIFANCLRYNTGRNDGFRPVATDVLEVAEESLALFLSKRTDSTGSSSSSSIPYYPRLLHRWDVCVGVLNKLLDVTNPDDGHQTAHYFLHPPSFYFGGGELPKDYLAKVRTPMDLGSVTSKLIEGDYRSVGAFVADCCLVCKNCISYHTGKETGKSFIEQAKRLQRYMEQEMGSLMRFDPANHSEAASILENPNSPVPRKTLLVALLQDLRAAQYTDRFTKLSEQASLPFEKPVDCTIFTDYRQYVETPMDLETVERSIEKGVYQTPEDFEYDVLLIFKNCEKYNVPKHNDHIVALARHCKKAFNRLYNQRMKSLEDNNTANRVGPNKGGISTKDKRTKESEEKKRRAHSPLPASKETKKPRTDTFSRRNSMSSTVSVSSAGKTSSKSKPQKSSSGTGKRKAVAIATTYDSNSPLPLHVAVAQVKQKYPNVRLPKALVSWEGACYRFLKELMKHQWISVQKTKFFFTAPVEMLHPEVKEVYIKKIERPMDLTTIDCTLLQGGIYTSPEQVVSDVALVFLNAITFNQAGHDEGEPLSCSYFDAARHLLRYTRWLSLEYLASCFNKSEKNHGSDATISSEIENGMVKHWDLNKKNREESRREMEKIVLKQPMEKSEIGDRYTWMESEGEKLLKALRHQSDLRYMTYYIQPQYPGDYAAYVSKPMDWEKCQRNLQNRVYETLGDVVDDLRLIFSNALKYNARAKGTDTVSGRAYEAAIYMSTKLETAIDKMLLSVADRLERDKIDKRTVEREREASERERRLAAWQKDRDESRKPAVHVETKVEIVETVKVIRKAPQRKDAIDFEPLFYDEDNDEQVHMERVKQIKEKELFEMQKRERIEMQEMTLTLGVSLYTKLAERDYILSRIELKKLKDSNLPGINSLSSIAEGDVNKKHQDKAQAPTQPTVPVPTKILSERTKFKICLKSSKKAKKRARLVFS